MPKELSHDELLRALYYDPSTGVFIWKRDQCATALEGDPAGTIDSGGYCLIQVNGVRTGAHRLAWFYVYGVWPEKLIDHIDGDPSNNKLENLRVVSNSENCRNGKLRKNSASGVLGVSFNLKLEKWVAYISTKDGLKHLGYFRRKELAIQARREAEAKYGYHPNHGRTS